MASINISRTDLIKLARQCDQPYEWPNFTCMQFPKLIVEHEHGLQVQPLYTTMSEEYATRHLFRNHGGRWWNWMSYHLIKTLELAEICEPDSEIKDADFTEILCDIEHRSPVKTPRNRNLHVAVVVGESVYIKTTISLYPVPIKEVKILNRMRVKAKCRLQF